MDMDWDDPNLPVGYTVEPHEPVSADTPEIVDFDGIKDHYDIIGTYGYYQFLPYTYNILSVAMCDYRGAETGTDMHDVWDDYITVRYLADPGKQRQLDFRCWQYPAVSADVLLDEQLREVSSVAKYYGDKTRTTWTRQVMSHNQYEWWNGLWNATLKDVMWPVQDIDYGSGLGYGYRWSLCSPLRKSEKLSDKFVAGWHACDDMTQGASAIVDAMTSFDNTLPFSLAGMDLSGLTCLDTRDMSTPHCLTEQSLYNHCPLLYPFERCMELFGVPFRETDIWSEYEPEDFYAHDHYGSFSEWLEDEDSEIRSTNCLSVGLDTDYDFESKSLSNQWGYMHKPWIANDWTLNPSKLNHNDEIETPLCPNYENKYLTWRMLDTIYTRGRSREAFSPCGVNWIHKSRSAGSNLTYSQTLAVGDDDNLYLSVGATAMTLDTGWTDTARYNLLTASRSQQSHIQWPQSWNFGVERYARFGDVREWCYTDGDYTIYVTPQKPEEEMTEEDYEYIDQVFKMIGSSGEEKRASDLSALYDAYQDDMSELSAQLSTLQTMEQYYLSALTDREAELGYDAYKAVYQECYSPKTYSSVDELFGDVTNMPPFEDFVIDEYGSRNYIWTQAKWSIRSIVESHYGYVPQDFEALMDTETLGGFRGWWMIYSVDFSEGEQQSILSELNGAVATCRSGSRAYYASYDDETYWQAVRPTWYTTHEEMKLNELKETDEQYKSLKQSLDNTRAGIQQTESDITLREMEYNRDRQEIMEREYEDDEPPSMQDVPRLFASRNVWIEGRGPKHLEDIVTAQSETAIYPRAWHSHTAVTDDPYCNGYLPNSAWPWQNETSVAVDTIDATTIAFAAEIYRQDADVSSLAYGVHVSDKSDFGVAMFDDYHKWLWDRCRSKTGVGSADAYWANGPADFSGYSFSTMRIPLKYVSDVQLPWSSYNGHIRGRIVCPMTGRSKEGVFFDVVFGSSGRLSFFTVVHNYGYLEQSVVGRWELEDGYTIPHPPANTPLPFSGSPNDWDLSCSPMVIRQLWFDGVDGGGL